MRELPDASIDALISDPPYATTNLKWDQPIYWAAFWMEARRVCKPNAIQALFAQQPFATDLINSNRKAFRYEIVWEKSRAMGFLDCNIRPMRCHELILVFCDKWRGKTPETHATYNPQKTAGKPYRSRYDFTSQHYGKHCAGYVDNQGDRYPRDVLKFSNVHKAFFGGEVALHPTQKPIDLMKWLVLSYSNPGDVILDPFSGSGSTAAACVETGRDFIGIERDPGYHAISLERIAKHQAAKQAKTCA